MPDGEKILREAAIDVEQETGFVKYDKKQIIFEYCLYTIMNLKKPYACDVVEKLVVLFTTIKNITCDIRRDLFSSLCMMVKYHFKDYKRKRELIKMMLQSVPYEQQKALSRDEKREIQFANARRLLNLKDEIIHKKDEDILQRDDIICQNEQNLLQKDKKNARLKELLRKNNIDF